MIKDLPNIFYHFSKGWLKKIDFDEEDELFIKELDKEFILLPMTD